MNKVHSFIYRDNSQQHRYLLKIFIVFIIIYFKVKNIYGQSGTFLLIN